MEILRQFDLGDTSAQFLIDRVTQRAGLRLVPIAMLDKLVPRRATLRGLPEIDVMPGDGAFPAAEVDSLFQIKVVGEAYPGGFANGLTMRNSDSTLALRFDSQDVQTDGGTTIVRTVLLHPRGLRCTHHLSWRDGDAAGEVWCEVRNDGASSVTLEHLSSFTLGDITPFHRADAPERLRIHRYRTHWSAEGRHEVQTIEQLHLETSWHAGTAAAERFGQAGTMPVRQFFPLVAAEDVEARVLWGARLAWAGSWQMEIYRRGDALALGGGIADRELGHWTKTLSPGEALTTPRAIIACAQGDIDDLTDRLVALDRRTLDVPERAVEIDLPIICNEWCTSWGNPTHENLTKLADRLAGTEVKYLVIDAGWYREDGKDWASAHGDWRPNARQFPHGLKATADAIRQRGLVPGLWFELETVGPDSRAYAMTDHLLKRDGQPLTVGVRRFWDMADPFVFEYLSQRVIDLLESCSFGYLKIDYNETIGLGADGADSLGESVRRQVKATCAFFREIRRRLPRLVVEMCSSGGHRIEPSMLALCDMHSFSDAHEGREIPIIAANVQRLMLPQQSQIWAVLRRNDDRKRLVYSLAATFLGRMCISGDIGELRDDQWQVMIDAQRLYRAAWPIIKHGRSRRFGPEARSYRHPRGWQAVLRTSDDDRSALLAAHSFELPSSATDVAVPLPAGEWDIEASLAEGVELSATDAGQATLRLRDSFAGGAFKLVRRHPSMTSSF